MVPQSHAHRTLNTYNDGRPYTPARVVGDCPDFRAGIGERKWDCPLHAFRL